MSLGLKKCTMVDHPKYEICLVSGNNGIDRISLVDITTGEHLTQKLK